MFGEHLLSPWETWAQLPALRQASFQIRGIYIGYVLEWKVLRKKYLQDRFSATVVTQPHKDARKLDGLLPILLPHWSGREAPVRDEVAIA